MSKICEEIIRKRILIIKGTLSVIHNNCFPYLVVKSKISLEVFVNDAA